MKIARVLVSLVFAAAASSCCWSQGVSSQLVTKAHYAEAGEGCTGACHLTLPFPTSRSGNFLNVALAWQYGGAAPTISNVYCNSDTTHQTWTWTEFGHSVLDTADRTDLDDYYVAGATAGCTSVTFVFSSVWSNAEADYQEFSGIATASAVDVTSGQVSTAPTMNSGAMTTTVDGDLIYEHCLSVPMPISGPNATSVTFSGGFTGLDADIFWADASDALVQTNAGAITPAMNFVGLSAGNNGACVALALKTQPGAGTAPTGVHIVSQDDFFGNANPTKFQTHMFNAGDALVVQGLNNQGGNGSQWTGIGDTLGSSFTSHTTSNSGVQFPEWAIDCADSAGDDLITLSGVTTSGNGNYVVLEIAGVNNSSHTACYDSTAGLATNWGNNAPYSPAPSITPSTLNGIVMASENEGVGPITGITGPSGGVYAYPTYTGQTDASEMTEGGGFSYLFNTTTTAQSWTWSTPNSSAWVASAIALVAGSQGPPPAPPTNLQVTVH